MANNIPRFQMPRFIPLTDESVGNTGHLRNINNLRDDNCYKRLKLEPIKVDDKDISSSVPWMKRTSYSPGVVGLHEEMNDFYQTLSPTREEREIRSKVIGHIRHTVLALWPQAKVEVFGSFRTGLLLPSSDIDIVVTGKWEHLPLNTLRTALIESGIKAEDISVLATAAVPIIKLVHSITKVKVDISFNVRNGVKSAKMIKEFMKLYPALPKLVLVLKQFLVHRGLNEVYHGGMSSYTLTILIISFLQGHHRPKSLQVSNLGILLLEFFELYGINFNYEKISVDINDGGSYRPKVNPWAYLSIEDPVCEGNDIAKGTYLMYQIKSSFENAYNMLHKAVTEVYERSSLNRPASILKLILDVDPEVFRLRHWFRENFNTIMKMFPAQCESDSEAELSETIETFSSQVTHHSSMKKTAENHKHKSRTPFNNSPTESLRTEFENGFQKLGSHKNIMSAKQELRSAQNRHRAPFNAKDSSRYKRSNCQMSRNLER